MSHEGSHDGVEARKRNNRMDGQTQGDYLGPVWNAGISQESHRNFTGISSISQEKHRNGEKIPHSKQALSVEFLRRGIATP